MPDYYLRCAFRGQNETATQYYVNALHVRVSSLASLDDLSGSASAIEDRFEDAYRALIVDFQHLIDLTVSAEPGSFEMLATYEQAINLVGTRPGSNLSLSDGLCALTSLKTAYAGRSFRGRIFNFPAVTSGGIADGGLWNPTNAYYVACQGLATLMTEGWTVGDSDFIPIVYSRTRQARGDDPFAALITGAVVDTKQHFLRSRQN